MARATERVEREQAEYQCKLAAREAKEKARGRKLGGKAPEPPAEGPKSTDQINLTDEESRLMPVAGGGFEHTVADLADDGWKAARAAVGARKRFFEDLRAITTCLVFPNRAAILETLRSGKATAVCIRDG